MLEKVLDFKLLLHYLKSKHFARLRWRCATVCKATNGHQIRIRMWLISSDIWIVNTDNDVMKDVSGDKVIAELFYLVMNM